MADNTNILNLGEKYYSKLIFKKSKFPYNSMNIRSIMIKEFVYNILPTVELVLGYDPSVFEQIALEDNDEFSIYLANSPNTENILKMDCIVHDYKIGIIGDDKSKVIQITGILKCKNMFILKNKCYTKKTSNEVCSEIAGDCGLVFKKSDNIITNDRMTWYQLNQNYFDFIKHVLKRAYVHDDCVMLYGDHDGNLNYTTINKEIGKKGTVIAKFSVENYSNWDPPEQGSTLWYNSYEIINLQGTFNKESNYGVKNEFYDLTNEDFIIYSNFKKMTDVSFVDNDYKGKPVFNYYGGIFNNKNMYGDTGEKYFESYVRNYFIKNNLCGLSIVLNINSNSNVKLFDKIHLDVNSQIYKVGSDNFWSGEYLITGINYFIATNGIYQKRILLSRNGYNKPDIKDFPARNYDYKD